MNRNPVFQSIFIQIKSGIMESGSDAFFFVSDSHTDHDSGIIGSQSGEAFRTQFRLARDNAFLSEKFRYCFCGKFCRLFVVDDRQTWTGEDVIYRPAVIKSSTGFDDGIQFLFENPAGLRIEKAGSTFEFQTFRDDIALVSALDGADVVGDQIFWRDVFEPHVFQLIHDSHKTVQRIVGEIRSGTMAALSDKLDFEVDIPSVAGAILNPISACGDFRIYMEDYVYTYLHPAQLYGCEIGVEIFLV